MSIKRIIDLSLPARPCPEGSGFPIGYPYSIEKLSFPQLVEPVSKERSLAEILGYYEIRHVLLGPFPQEIFSLGILTSKPHTTLATYYQLEKIRNGISVVRDISQVPVTQLVGEAVILDLSQVEPGQDIDAATLKKVGKNVKKGDMVFVHTGYSDRYRKAIPTPEYYENSPGFTLDAARWLIEIGIKALGTDTRTIESKSIDPAGEIDVHYLLNCNDILTIEDLTNLGRIGEERVPAIIGLPLKMYGASGGPARVIVLKGQGKNFEIIDCSHRLTTYPRPEPSHPYPFLPPLPERIEPREYQSSIMRWARITPFLLEGDGVRGSKRQRQEMYIHFSHASHSHVEAAFFDPFEKFGVPLEILKKYRTMPLERLVGEAALVDLANEIGPRQTIEVKHLEKTGKHIKEGDVVLLKTEIHDWYFYGDGYVDITPGLTESAAEWLVSKKIKALVIDFPTVEMSTPPSGVPGVRYTANNVHYLLHKNDIPIVEKCRSFAHLKKERLFVAILPLPASCLGGFPAHVLAIEEWE